MNYGEPPSKYCKCKGKLPVCHLASTLVSSFLNGTEMGVYRRDKPAQCNLDEMRDIDLWSLMIH
jgi:hypothetical protein